MMLEADRLAYLNALGITQYVALNPIAGAQQLPVLAPEQIWPEPDATHDAKGDHTAVQAPQHGLQSSPADQRDQVQGQTAQQPAGPQTPPQTPAGGVTEAEETVPRLDLSKLNLETEVATQPVTKPQARVQQFALAVITVTGQYRLFVELELADAPGLSAVEHRMVTDLLILLGQPQGLDSFGAKLYRWPMVTNPRIAADAQAARDGLLGFIASAPTVSRNVFLGMKATTVLADTSPGQIFALPDAGEADSLATYSLAEMRQDWRHKAAFWSTVFPFLTNP